MSSYLWGWKVVPTASLAIYGFIIFKNYQFINLYEKVKIENEKNLIQIKKLNNDTEIKNFKSIKDLKLEPKKYNIFIGEPNVGKSNILEAISVLNPFYSANNKFLEGIVRYKSLLNLFFDDDLPAP